MKNEINEKNIMNMRREDVYANREKSAVLNWWLERWFERWFERFKQHFSISNEAFLFFGDFF